MQSHILKCSECNELVVEAYEDDVDVVWSLTICPDCSIPPELPDMSPEGPERSNPRWFRRDSLISKMVCKVRGHVVNPGDYIDSHGNHDALTYCERCGEYDV